MSRLKLGPEPYAGTAITRHIRVINGELATGVCGSMLGGWMVLERIFLDAIRRGLWSDEFMVYRRLVGGMSATGWEFGRRIF